MLREPTLLKREPAGEVPDGTRVISEQTSEQLRQLMRLVVQIGTGKKANAPGYLVGGKTGTADKQNGATATRPTRALPPSSPLSDERPALRDRRHGRRTEAQLEQLRLRHRRLGDRAGGSARWCSGSRPL